MTVFVGLLIGNETWELQERSVKSIRSAHPEQAIVIYYSLDKDSILSTLSGLGVEAVDLGRPEMLNAISPSKYSLYNSFDFNIKSSFKWIALLEAMKSKSDDAIFIDADIKVLSAIPLASFGKIWKAYDILVQDEGSHIFPKHPCTGFMGFKYCETNITLLETLHKEQCAAIISGEGQHDQATFYKHISGCIDVYKKVYFLSQVMFPVGYMGPIYARFKPATEATKRKRDPILFHANWTIGIKAKAALMDAFHEAESGQ
ncbi:hypothetical protein KBY96_07985 [Cyanobium sp. ATX 6A2]|uniref:putative nucleotide-diphospho-sugar transferase n=1 Tax=Cyanobium sp. ATX 6A2 TaxID=2823700 RepID=UPI0020CDE965|nr:putative nucleotide-diphospho-sugar transferase [Cyanobium sp. ATX 6A2]MCP9887868.1 hypothetical protein [Cyanobium sp. ATX 6A2]